MHSSGRYKFVNAPCVWKLALGEREKNCLSKFERLVLSGWVYVCLGEE